MKTLRLLAAVAIVLCVIGLPRTQAAEKSVEQLQTTVLGGVALELAAMQRGQYVLRAAGGELREVQVQKPSAPRPPGTRSVAEYGTGPGWDDGLRQPGQPDVQVHRRRADLDILRTRLAGGGTGSFKILSDGRFITTCTTRRASAVTARAWSWRTT